MSIFKQIQDIISANLNDMIENLENPEQMLRQAIREMEDAIHRVKPDVAGAMANERTIGKELAANESQSQIWQNRAVAALEAGDEQLARKALGRKLEYEKVVAALTDQVAAAKKASQMLKRQLDAMEAKLSDAQRRLCTLIARSRAADIRCQMAKFDTRAHLDEENAFAKFDRLKRKVERAEAEAEAMAELARSREGADDVVASYDEGVQLDVERELAMLKQRVKSL